MQNYHKLSSSRTLTKQWMPDGASAIWRHDHVDDEWGRPAIPLAPLLANAYVHWVASGWMHDHLPMPQIWVPCRIEKMKNHQTHARHVVFWSVGPWRPNTLHDVRDVVDRLWWLPALRGQGCCNAGTTYFMERLILGEGWWVIGALIIGQRRAGGKSPQTQWGIFFPQAAMS